MARILSLLVFSFILITILFQVAFCDNHCLSRDYGNGGTVCVCNTDHCDTISRPEKVGQPQYLTYTSNKAGLRFNKLKGTFSKRRNSFQNQITVDSVLKFQRIQGWGGAFTDSTGYNIASLKEEVQENLLKSYFSTEGAEYSLCRVPIGGTDFSLHGYSYDDGAADPELNNFKLALEDFQYKIPYIKSALNLTNGNLQLFASAWTAPKWMKTNGEYDGFGFLLESMYQSWAKYFVKFLDSYQKEGIHFWGITTGNEPSLAIAPFNKINSVGWTPSKMGKWILNNLGPTIRNSSHSNIKVMILDDQRFFLPWFINATLQNNITRQFIDGIAVHWYYDTIFSANLLTKTHETFPEKFILATEACQGDKFWEKDVDLGSWDRGESYANDIIEDLTNWVVGWVDWNMVLDLTGGPTYINNFVDSPIIVNSTAGEFYKQPMFYSLAHFSKFIPRNSVRIYSTTFDSQIPVAAFQRPDNATVVVILNKKENEVDITLSDSLRGNTRISLSSKSITTVLYW